MQSQARLNFAEVQPKIAKSNLNNMNILVTGANGQLGDEMRIIAQESPDKYIFTDVNQVVIYVTYDTNGCAAYEGNHSHFA